MEVEAVTLDLYRTEKLPCGSAEELGMRTERGGGQVTSL